MYYHLFAYDKTFDLMGDPVPESLVFSFLDPVRRARKVLEGRTSKQVASLLATMDRYLDKGGELLHQEAMEDSDPQGFTVYRVKALKYASGKMEIEPLPDLPDATWADYFAALSLAYLVEHLYEVSTEDVNQTLEMERRLTKGAITEEIQQQRAQARLNTMVFEALDAVAYAEQLQRESGLLDQATQRVTTKIRRDRASAGGQGRAKKYEPLKRHIFEIFKASYQHYSDRRAAFLIYRNELTAEQQAVFQTEDPEITIAKWLGPYRRSLKSPK